MTGLRYQLFSLKNEVVKQAHCDDGRAGHQLAQMMRQIQQWDCLSGPETTTGTADGSPSTTSKEPLDTGLLEEPYPDPMGLLTSEETSSFSTDDHFGESMNV